MFGNTVFHRLFVSALAVIGLVVAGWRAGSPAPIAQTQATTPAGHRALARLEPEHGTLFGVSLDWAQDGIDAYTGRSGRTPAVYVAFTHFPVEAEDEPGLERFTDEVQHVQGMALLTVEPTIRLAAITPVMADEFAERLASYNRRGIPVMLRFAHEMNGAWYPWGQQPHAYVAAFRLIAEAVHERAAQTAMLWAPNYGAGYPFHGGDFEAQHGTPDFSALDTNRDGRLDEHDDMYAPYYPGDDAVDWVGMTLYHWGDRWPWGQNVIPEPGKFLAQLTGTYVGAAGDQRGLPNFYKQYAEQHAKPFAVPETAALYNTRPGDDLELEIKRAWWRQVFSADLARDLPELKMINWFEWRKTEAEIENAVVDWTATTNPRVRAAFIEDLASAPLAFAPSSAITADMLTATPALEPQHSSPDLTSAPVDPRAALRFSGNTWRVRSSLEPEGPGPNHFSDSPATAWTDDEDRLHLRVGPDPSTGDWQAGEVMLEAHLGYGTYTFEVASPLDDLDPNVVLGLFTWSDDPQQNHRELDIEFARFGQPTGPIGRFTLQPYTEPGNVHVFDQPAGTGTRHSVTWAPGRVTFESRTSSGDLIARYVFSGSVPTPADEQVHVNLWLDAGRPPESNEPVEVVLQKFQFFPLQTDPPPPE